MVPLTRESNHHFHCAPRFATSVLALVSDSLVRVSRRGKEHHFLCLRRSQGSHCTPTTTRHEAKRDECRPPPATPHPERPARTNQRPASHRQHATTGLTGDLRFPLSNFRHYLTFFSKFFSSFLHSTCSLSVSHPYLAFDGIYHPLRAAIPSNSTRLRQPSWIVHFKSPGTDGIVTLSDAPFCWNFSRATIRGMHATTPEGFAPWALPASVALTGGILVSFFSSA